MSPGDPGPRFGRYVVRRRIGAGGMGVVHEAYDPELKRRVALKLVRLDAGSPAAARERLLREAQLTAKLSDPNVVAVYDVGSLGDDLFVAMELVDGPTLRIWLAERPRGWREVLGVFREAGRGLAAAHRANLVHRDFKPDNVLLGADGRARVADFGLSRALDTAPEPALRGGGEPVALEAITATGRALGTPRYMSPEQYQGLPAGPGSDQFSFCVALWEALAGARAFAPTTYQALGRAVIGGDLEPPPRGRIPRFARRALVRGLSPRPEDRFPSMEALLAALAADPRRAAAPIGAALSGALAVALVVAAAGGPARLRLCRGGPAKVAAVWDEAQRTAGRRAFLATGASFAADAWSGAGAELDAQARAIAATHREVCEATQVRGEQSAEVMDRKMECLDARLGELRALAELFGRADPQVVERAVAAAQGLTPAAECLDARRLPGGRRTADPDLRARLDEVGALALAGRYHDALPLAAPLPARAAAAGDPLVEADALLALGDLQSRDGDARAAEPTLWAAARSAMAGGDLRLAASIYLQLAHIVGLELEQGPRGLDHARTAAVLVAGFGGDLWLEGRLAGVEGAILVEQGRAEEALARMERSRELLERARGAEHVDVARALSDLGGVYRTLGRFPEALAAQERALAIREKLLGPGHPFVSSTLLNLGNVYYSQGRYAPALEYYQRAIERRERALGPDHPNLAEALVAEAQALDSLGRPEEALAVLRRAEAIHARRNGGDHPDMGRTLNAIGDVLMRLERPAEALDAYRRGLAIKERSLGLDHPSVAVSVYSVGDALLALGDGAGALAAFERALAIDHAARGADSPDLAFDLTGIGRAHLLRGNPAAAIAPLERALALRGASAGDPADLGETQFTLARALWATGRERARAQSLAGEARAAFTAAGEGRKEDLELVDAWLRGRR